MVLSDAYLRKFSALSNARVIFSQSLKQADLIWHLYSIFQQYCSAGPSTNRSLIKETGNYRETISFGTRSLPCFNFVYSLFYLEGVKIIPLNIAEYLTPISLAFWIMGDGGWAGYGVRLYTNSFTLTEVELLQKALNNRFNFNTTIQKTSKKGLASLGVFTLQPQIFLNLEL